TCGRGGRGAGGRQGSRDGPDRGRRDPPVQRPRAGARPARRPGVMSLAEAAAVLGARLTGGDHVFHSVSTDTRTLEPGALFVALRGDRFDGHDYIEAAMSAGAAGVLGERAPEAVPAILVDDSLDAL